uniref:Uncharacterized protein n=1 Tax=Pyxicephalus adspersus TaxID=30357 RepID=A0AAV3A7H2_PYXAD|nr:TPA: hypothetical protein GDO54_013451 [Pyxicephalus adspersus]
MIRIRSIVRQKCHFSVIYCSNQYQVSTIFIHHLSIQLKIHCLPKANKHPSSFYCCISFEDNWVGHMKIFWTGGGTEMCLL